MSKLDVELLAGLGTSFIMEPSCEQCPPDSTQFTYEGNSSLWSTRFEDTLVICYDNDIVCDITRIGLGL
jgi:hypothetical protein